MPDKRLPLAYLITYTCYGTRLHGNDAGSFQNKRFVKHNEGLERYERGLMKQESYRLDAGKAAIALASMHETSAYRKWVLLACHLDNTHVHMVVIASDDPKRVIGDMKSYSSRALTRSGCDSSTRKRWTSGGSARYLWDNEAVLESVDYVVNKQGKPLAAYKNPELIKILEQIR